MVNCKILSPLLFYNFDLSTKPFCNICCTYIVQQSLFIFPLCVSICHFDKNSIVWELVETARPAFAKRQRPPQCRGLHGFRWLQTIRSSVCTILHVVEWLARGRDELRTSRCYFCSRRIVVEYVLKIIVLLA